MWCDIGEVEPTGLCLHFFVGTFGNDSVLPGTLEGALEGGRAILAGTAEDGFDGGNALLEWLLVLELCRFGAIE